MKGLFYSVVCFLYSFVLVANAAVPEQFVKEYSVVEFDKLYDSGDQHIVMAFYNDGCTHCEKLLPEYNKVAKDFAGEEKINFGMMLSDSKIISRYNIRQWPTVMYFGPEQKGLVFEGERNQAVLTEFLNKHTGTKRSPNGGLLPGAGRIDALDEIAKIFIGTSHEDSERLSVYKELLITDASKNRFAEFYRTVASKIIEEGDDYPSKEVIRLKHVLRSGEVAASKVDGFNYKINILNSFVPKFESQDEL